MNPINEFFSDSEPPMHAIQQLKNNTNGLDAGKKIREAGIDTPIIFTTGNSYNKTVQMVKDISHTVVLTKPVELEQLLKLLNNFNS